MLSDVITISSKYGPFTIKSDPDKPDKLQLFLPDGRFATSGGSVDCYRQFVQLYEIHKDASPYYAFYGTIYWYSENMRVRELQLITELHNERYVPVQPRDINGKAYMMKTKNFESISTGWDDLTIVEIE